MASNKDGKSEPKLIPPLFLTEALGFSPQHLLDDIINTANHAVQDGVNGMEDFLQTRAEQLDDEEITRELEQGLVAFQTLLEYHTDVAFDFFEVWSLRNIFAIPADLPVVLPHHEHLDLSHPPEHEQGLIDELEELRTQIDNQRRLKVHLKRTKHKRSTELRRAKKLFEALSSYEAAIDASKTMPDRLMAMHKSVSTLPELSPATVTMLSEFQHTEAGKRKWETGKLGYVNWAIAQLLAKSAEAGGGELLPDIANTEMYRKACEVMDGVSKNLEAAEETDDPMGS